MTTDTTRNGYKKAEGTDGLAAYLVGDLRDTLDALDINTAKCNYAAAVNPTANDDSGDDYSVGSRWINLTDDKLFICLDDTLGAAIWAQIYPAVQADLGTTLTELGDIPYWGAGVLAGLHHANKNDVFTCQGHGLPPIWSALASDGWVDANETWLYSSSGAPNYTFTISGDKTNKYYPGMRLKLTQSGAVKYFIVMKVTYSAPNTSMLVYGGTDYVLTNNAISVNYYSTAKCPLGFPLSNAKWSITLTDTSDRSQATAAANSWYNPGSLTITIPIGIWDIFFKANIAAQWSGYAQRWAGVTCGLATASNGTPDSEFTFQVNAGADMRFLEGFATIRQHRIVTTDVIYYVVIGTDSTESPTIHIDGATRNSSTQITAVCAYL